MKVRNVQAHLLSYPFPAPIHLSYYGGQRSIHKRDAMLIRIETSNGLVGYAPGQGSEAARDAVMDTIRHFLLDKTIADPDALRVLFHKTVGSDEFLTRAYCSVEIALYDILGKAKGLPVSELIGERVRDRIRLYGSAGMYMPPERYAEEAAGVAGLGFRAYKMRPALGPEGDVETVRRMREATGPAFDLMIDAHTWWRMGDKSYTYETVREVAGQMAEYEIAWLEEPMPPHQHELYRKLHDEDLVPLASGEHEPDETGYLDLIAGAGVDYVQMDVVCQGGYSMARRIFPEIAAGGLKFAFHSWGTALEVIAAAQLGICWPENVVEWLEYPCYSTPSLETMYAFPIASEILTEPLEIVEGDLIVPRGPGLGVDIDERVIAKYPWIPGPWSSFSIESPAETWTVSGDHSVRWADH
ncbi:MAG: mandelate racemase/muconate lactonizing enzyme family protein [Bryobacteraceae bacterium]|nr:mandelate racemase/muconate lactonizing enzyme family protein [Bryobacteraceae bacterium]